VKFVDEPTNLAVFVCRHIINGERSAVYVSLTDGDLQVTCGGTDHANSSSGCLMGLGELLQTTADLRNLESLADEHFAELNETGSWVISPI
jgi:hypothetical protein